MATLIPNTFASFELSQSEEEAGQILNVHQKMVIQNKMSETAIQKLNLVYDPKDPADFEQQISYLQGQLDVLNWQLDSSSATEIVIAERSKSPDSPNQ